jgi:RNA-binding protein
MALTPKQRSFLRGQAHHLNPIVMIGKGGLSESLIKSLYQALRSHELVKIKIPADDQETFHGVVEEIFAHCEGLEKVQTIGHLLVVYRPSTPAGKVSKTLREAKIPYTKAQAEAAREVVSSAEEE